VGALTSGWVYDNNPSMFTTAFWIGGILAFLAFTYLMLERILRLKIAAKA
jgi:hypothetical protein